jgi:hypothetical protein
MGLAGHFSNAGRRAPVPLSIRARTDPNLANYGPKPYILVAIVRVAYAYQKDRARHGSKATAAQATACRERY